jgi:NAD-dependent deacetylase
LNSPICQIAEWLAAARAAVVLTGAGISTESGIPDFRSPQWVWARSRPVEFDEFLRSPAARYEYWRQKAVSHREFSSAAPNAAHEVLARWEQAGRIRAVITQNIDGLHQQAGSRRVLELHGTARDVVCLECGERQAAEPWVARFLADDAVPSCPRCGGLLKHATISFGQALPAEVLAEATRLAQQADVFLVLGSSLVVYPAAGLPLLAHRHGARLVILNQTETPLDAAAAIVLREKLGAVLPAIDAHLNEALRAHVI